MNRLLLACLSVVFAYWALSVQVSAHSMDPNSPWAVDIVIGYQDSVRPVPLGFLPASSHTEAAGMSLRHVDIARSFFLEEHGVYSRVTIAAHGDEVAVDEAFAMKTLAPAWTLTVGQVMPSLGLYNNQHEHRWRLNDLPLVYTAMWGGQLSEGAVLVSWSLDHESSWALTQKVGLYSTHAFDTQGNSGAVLWNNQFTYQAGSLSASVFTDVYFASLNDRGMNVFSTDPTQHSHNSTYADVFDGTLWHVSTSVSLGWHSAYGELVLNSEYQTRRDDGVLSSAQGETLDASGDINLESWGAFSELSWTGHSGLLLAVRQQTLGSQVELNNLASNDLETSVLNNPEGTINGQSWMLGYRFADSGTTKIKVQFNDVSGWAGDGPQWSVALQQGYRF